MTDTAQGSPAVRRFVVAAVPGALVSWSVGFELGAFDVVSYRRVFAIFVVCAVVLVATFLWPSTGFATSWWSRGILALPVAYIGADALLLTDSVLVAGALAAAIDESGIGNVDDQPGATNRTDGSTYSSGERTNTAGRAG